MSFRFHLMVSLVLSVAFAGRGDDRELEFHSRGVECDFYTGSVQPSGSMPIVAECLWPNVTVGVLDSLLGDAEGQTALFSSVASTEVLEQSDDTFTIRQVHVNSRISPREGVIVFTREEAAGRVTHRYTLAEAQPPVASGHVNMKEHQGRWSFESSVGGGIQLTYEATYLPGGNIPALLVRRFQTPAMINTVEEVYRAAHR